LKKIVYLEELELSCVLERIASASPLPSVAEQLTRVGGG